MTYSSPLVPMLRVEDLERSIAFYGELGFEVNDEVREDGRRVWAYLDGGGAEVMLSEQPGEVRVERRGGAILYLYPEDVPALHAHLSDRGLAVSPLRTTLYEMVEFDLDDPDGYELWFGRPAASS